MDTTAVVVQAAALEAQAHAMTLTARGLHAALVQLERAGVVRVSEFRASSEPGPCAHATLRLISAQDHGDEVFCVACGLPIWPGDHP